MSEPLVFRMGNFDALFPLDRNYARNHMWAQEQSNGSIRFGFSAYAVRLLLDVYFLEWFVDGPCDLEARQEIGAIESKKAESSLYAPMPGKLLRFNSRLLDDPSTINLDNYASGWLFDMQGSGEGLLSPEGYLEHMGKTWAVAQKSIRGQME
jgi:glycine cleavage system H protein